MNSVLDKEKMIIHLHHDLKMVGYGGELYENISLECNTCNEVLADVDVNGFKEL